MAAPDDAGLKALAEAVARHALGTGRSLVTAESCTGGWISKVCTDLPGSSRWFACGVVSYSNESKYRQLGVAPDLVAQYGAVSEQVVRAMAVGALERLGGDLSVAVSGVAGPDGGTAEKPVGTVWLAWAARGAAGAPEVAASLHVFPGDRESIRRRTVQAALAGLLER